MAASQLGRTIGFRGALSLMVGTVIGSGIFMRPAEVAALLGAPWLMLLAWILGGLVTALVTMVLAEEAAMLPDEGGTYNLMYHMFGDFFAYLYGWACFMVINCAGTAGIAFIFSEYFSRFVALPRFSAAIEQSLALHIPVLGTVYPLENFGTKLFTVVLLGILSYVNYRSTRAGNLLQILATYAKVLAIALLSLGLLWSGQGNWSHFLSDPSLARPEGMALVLAMAAAVNGSFQAYDGANNLLFITGEIKDPQRNIPRALMIGMAICIIVYLLVNVGLLYIMPVSKMASSALVASDAAQQAFGYMGTMLVSVLICISVFGTTNSNVMTPPRLTYAMARRQHMLAFAGKIHPRFNTPGNAIILHFLMMVLLVFSGSFYMLTDMYIFIVWFFNVFFIAGLFVLRRKMPDAYRPYKVWGYPWMPALLLIANIVYVMLIVSKDVQAFQAGQTKVIHSVTGLAITAAGIPLYFVFRRSRKRA